MDNSLPVLVGTLSAAHMWGIRGNYWGTSRKDVKEKLIWRNLPPNHPLMVCASARAERRLEQADQDWPRSHRKICGRPLVPPHPLWDLPELLGPTGTPLWLLPSSVMPRVGPAPRASAYNQHHGKKFANKNAVAYFEHFRAVCCLLVDGFGSGWRRESAKMSRTRGAVFLLRPSEESHELEGAVLKSSVNELQAYSVG